MTASADVQAWLLLTFSLPVRRASERVDIWRKIRRTGALPFRAAGHLLPDSPANRERFEWIATAIRGHGGTASVMTVTAIDHLSADELIARFVHARARDYAGVFRELKRRGAGPLAVARLHKRARDLMAIDFFGGRVREQLEMVLARRQAGGGPIRTPRCASLRASYRGRRWMTRTRPGIDRVSSAWLIRRFIDPTASFIFVDDGDPRPADAVPFDMFEGKGFAHRGDDCTFETLCKEFRLSDPVLAAIAEAIHDADLGDEKFGRTEAHGLDRALVGWATQGITDDEILRRGMDLIEGLYQSSPWRRGQRAAKAILNRQPPRLS